MVGTELGRGSPNPHCPLSAVSNSEMRLLHFVWRIIFNSGKVEDTLVGSQSIVLRG